MSLFTIQDISPRLYSLTTQRAQLNLETRKTVDNIQEVNTKVKHSREEQTRMSAEKRHPKKSPEKGTDM